MPLPDGGPLRIVPAFSEYGHSEELELTAEEARRLAQALPREIRLESVLERPGSYVLTAGPVAGVIEVAGFTIEVRPKLPISRLLFLLGYTLDRQTWRDLPGWFQEETSIVEAIAAALARQASLALARGLLHGYLESDDVLTTVRGRIRIERQLARWYGETPPIEVTFVEFTDDILEHRLIKAAIAAVLRWPIRQKRTWELLRHVENLLAGITPLIYGRTTVPAVRYTRLNQHYRPAVELARLVLKLASFDATVGHVQSSGLLVNMFNLFQDFVEVAFREALSVHGVAVRGQDTRHTLDVDGRVTLRPDLVLERRNQPFMVGDAKYKKIEIESIPNADIYQALAYAVALGLPAAALVYPVPEAARADQEIRNIGIRILVRTLDLGQSPQVLLGQVEEVAAELRDVGRTDEVAA